MFDVVPESATARPADYRIGEVFAVRVAGLSTVPLCRLRHAASWAAIDEVIAGEDRLRTTGARLAGELFGPIGARPDAPERPRLIALRRDLHAGRRPGAHIWGDDLADCLPGELAGDVRDWLAMFATVSGRREALRAELARESAAALKVLRDLAGHPDLVQGIGQSSPALAQRLAAWRAAPPDAQPHRQTVLRLAKYVARASMKTSPWSAFTASGLGTWRPRSSDAAEYDYIDVVEVDRSLLHDVVAAFARDPRLREGIALRWNPTAVLDGDVFWFVAEGPREGFRAVRATPLTLLVRDATAQSGTISRTRLRHALGDVGGAPDRWIDTLADAGLLIRCAPFADQDPQATSTLHTWLRGYADDTHHRVGELLGEVADATNNYHRQGAEGRTEARRRLTAAATELSAHTSAEIAPEARRLVVESRLITGPEVTLDQSSLRPVFDDLDRLRRLMAVFDPGLPLKLAAADYVRERYGTRPAVPFLTFYRHLLRPEEPAPQALAVLQHYLGQGALRGAARADSIPRLAVLREARKRTWDQLYAAADATGAVDASTAERLIDDAPSFVRPVVAISCYAQVWTAADGPRLVVNAVSAGPCRGVGRIQHLLTLSGAEPDWPSPPIPAGQVEFRTDNRSNLDLRPRTADALDHPYAMPDSTSAPRPLTDLTVVLDAGTGQLRLHDGDGRVVEPAHLGLISERFLPPLQAVLVRVFGPTPTAMMQPWALRGGLGPPEPGAITHLPRLALGRVVMARACWRMRCDDFPVPGRGEAEDVFLIRLARWLRENGVPREFFARVIDVRRAAGKDRKPLYVDVTNLPLLHDLLRNLRDERQLLVLEEVLPVPGDRRVTEYIFDLTGTRDD